jgi:hypothetical protein
LIFEKIRRQKLEEEFIEGLNERVVKAYEKAKEH